jgi:beta-glucanase (GH16 family)
VKRAFSGVVALCAFAVGALLACNGTPTPVITAPPPGGPAPTPQWVLTWSDEFDGPASGIDATKWRFDLGDGCAAGICGWGNNEKEFYTDAADNIAINGQGQLAIVARVAPAGMTCYYGPCRYTSAKITTRGRMSAPPGRVEARIKLPSGQGLWPAFWMLGHTFPNTPWPQCGELDIMEFKGSIPTKVSSAIHGPGYSGNTPFAHTETLNATADGFHTFGIEWNSERAVFSVDNVVHYTVHRADVQPRGQWVFDQAFFVILNLAVGGHFDGDPASDDIFPATMLVDYVRVYARQ